mmetsp:Transcript_30063/g.73695  ORF Transcript_30063/g.73695 Transcript_30063/m.73695 type:complete len:247 (-) Transcript_30063:2027-2767(-)
MHRVRSPLLRKHLHHAPDARLVHLDIVRVDRHREVGQRRGGRRRGVPVVTADDGGEGVRPPRTLEGEGVVSVLNQVPDGGAHAQPHRRLALGGEEDLDEHGDAVALADDVPEPLVRRDAPYGNRRLALQVLVPRRAEHAQQPPDAVLLDELVPAPPLSAQLRYDLSRHLGRQRVPVAQVPHEARQHVRAQQELPAAPVRRAPERHHAPQGGEGDRGVRARHVLHHRHLAARVRQHVPHRLVLAHGR